MKKNLFGILRRHAEFIVSLKKTSFLPVTGIRTTRAILGWIRSKNFLIDRMSLRDVADMLGIQPSQLSHFFRQQFGMTFWEYRKRMRIKEAERLMKRYPLQSTTLIARSVGIDDRGNFRRDFIAVEGISPTLWRQRNIKRRHYRRAAARAESSLRKNWKFTYNSLHLSAANENINIHDMATNEKTKQELRQENLAESISSTEKFYQENKKTIWTVVAAVIVVILAVLAYIKFIYQPACNEAMEATFPAEQAFQNGEFQLALEGDAATLGFAEICDTYGAKAGKAVYFYAAVCAYENGAFEDALSYINKYKGSDKIMAARAIAFKGDCLASLEQNAKAAACFTKAAAKADNIFAAGYLFKAGIAYEALGQNDKALKAYETIKDKYAQSIEAYDIDKYIERVK